MCLQEQYINDKDFLLSSVEAAGLPRADAAAVLDNPSSKGEQLVQQELGKYAAVSGVPHFVINGRWVWCGYNGMMCGRELLSYICKAQLLCQLQDHVFVSLCWERTPCSRLGVWESCCIACMCQAWHAVHVPALAARCSVHMWHAGLSQLPSTSTEHQWCSRLALCGLLIATSQFVSHRPVSLPACGVITRAALQAPHEWGSAS